MGLDMYLARKTWVRQNEWDTNPQPVTSVTANGVPHPLIRPERVSWVTEEMAYWRKANHIHKWFVDNVQGGTDDCGEYDVTVEELTALRDLCKRALALADTNEILLPPEAGFFFGGTDITPWYWEDIDTTIKQLDAILAEDDGVTPFHYTYHATMGPDPFSCDGCHSGDFTGFDHFCDTLNVMTHELPQAFAAWLGHTTNWDGKYGQNDTERTRSEPD